MPDRKVVLITGATGRQGGALLRELRAQPLALRAMTRRPDSEPARALAKEGVEVVRGDLDSEASLRECLRGVWGVFSVQNTWEAGVEKEEEQGLRLARLAREAKVQHFVYTSVGSAHRRTGIPHFENKWRIEQLIRELAFPSHVIVRPVFFMENLLSPWFLQDGKLVSALQPDTELQMVATRDIGRVAARAFIRPAEMNRAEIDLAGSSATMARTAELMSQVLGREVPYVQIPMAEIRKNSEDFALMLEWFERVGYDADIPALEAKFGPLTRLPDFLRQNLRK